MNDKLVETQGFCLEMADFPYLENRPGTEDWGKSWVYEMSHDQQVSYMSHYNPKNDSQVFQVCFLNISFHAALLLVSFLFHAEIFQRSVWYLVLDCLYVSG